MNLRCAKCMTPLTKHRVAENNVACEPCERHWWENAKAIYDQLIKKLNL